LQIFLLDFLTIEGRFGDHLMAYFQKHLKNHTDPKPLNNSV